MDITIRTTRGVGMGMVASPSSSLNTPVGAGVASPGGEEAAYREKVRQLSKYIEPLRRMVHRMVSEGESECLSSNLGSTGDMDNDTVLTSRKQRLSVIVYCIMIFKTVFVGLLVFPSSFFFSSQRNTRCKYLIPKMKISLWCLNCVRCFLVQI